MALNFLGITVEPVGGGPSPTNIEVPPGSTAPLIPVPADPFDYKYIQDNLEIIVDVTVVDTDPTEAENFDNLYAVLANAVVTDLGDFNSTGKDVTAFAEWNGLTQVVDTLHDPASSSVYTVTYRLFVDVV